MHFKDNFSAHSNIYAQHRPVYSADLIEYLCSLTEEKKLVWDCGTGNGQCAFQLANYFDHVFASDPSEEQISNAYPHPKITYKVEKAEHSSLADNSVDLITVAQALHWFDLEAYYKEVYRVLKPQGVIAVIAYKNPKINAKIDAVIDELHDEILKDFWRPENHIVEEEYNTIPFPFHVQETPQFYLRKELNREDLLGHIRTWSAVQRYIKTEGKNPMRHLENALQDLWNSNELKTATWKIILKVGRPITA